MVSRKRVNMVILMVLTGALLTAGCSGDSPEENTDQACSSIEELRTAIGEARSALNEDSTVGQVRDQRDNLAEKTQAVVEDLEDVQQDRVTELREAYQQFDSSVENLNDDEALTDAVGSLQEEVSAIGEAQGDIAGELACN